MGQSSPPVKDPTKVRVVVITDTKKTNEEIVALEAQGFAILEAKEQYIIFFKVI